MMHTLQTQIEYLLPKTSVMFIMKLVTFAWRAFSSADILTATVKNNRCDRNSLGYSKSRNRKSLSINGLLAQTFNHLKKCFIKLTIHQDCNKLYPNDQIKKSRTLFNIFLIIFNLIFHTMKLYMRTKFENNLLKWYALRIRKPSFLKSYRKLWRCA